MHCKGFECVIETAGGSFVVQFANWTTPLFCFPVSSQGKTKCKRIPYSVRPAEGGTRRSVKGGRAAEGVGPYGMKQGFRVPRKRKEMQANPNQCASRRGRRPAGSRQQRNIASPSSASLRSAPSPAGGRQSESQPVRVPPRAGQDGETERRENGLRASARTGSQ